MRGATTLPGEQRYGFTDEQWDRLPAYARDRIRLLGQRRDEALAEADRARERLADDTSLAVLDPISDHLELPVNTTGRVVVQFRNGTGGAIDVESWPTRDDPAVRTIRVRATQGDQLVVAPRDSTSVELEVRGQ